MKILFLKMSAISFGAALAIGTLVIWHYHSANRWNSTAITSVPTDNTLFEIEDSKSGDEQYAASVFFNTTNNTSTDYSLLPKDVMESEGGTLLGTLSWKVFLGQGTTPHTLPSDFFDVKPIYIPAHTTVRIRLDADIALSASLVNKRPPHEVVKEELRGVSAAVVLDQSKRYRIEFPITNVDWQKK